MNCWLLKMADQAQYADKPGRTYVFDNTHSVRLAAGDTFAYLDKRGGCYAFTGHGVVAQLRQRAPRKSELLSPKITRVYLKAYANAVEQKAHCFVIDLPHSDGCFVKAYPAESTEAFLDGHVSALAFLGGVPQSILYDNTRLAVAKILGDGRRQRTRAFTELQSHYLFEDRFGRPGKGNDKGKVEGLVGYMRRNFLVPVPSFESFDALNAYLEQRCLERMDAQLRGHTETIGQRMERDLDALLPLPLVAYDACDKQASRVSSLSLVRYRTNDYSVPVAYGYRDVLVRGYVDAVVISCGTEVIASHPRSYERDDKFDNVGIPDSRQPIESARRYPLQLLRHCHLSPSLAQERTGHCSRSWAAGARYIRIRASPTSKLSPQEELVIPRASLPVG